MSDASNITPSGPYNCCDISFSICPPFFCKGNVQHFIYSKLDAADCAELVLKDDLEIVLYTSHNNLQGLSGRDKMS